MLTSFSASSVSLLQAASSEPILPPADTEHDLILEVLICLAGMGTGTQM